MREKKTGSGENRKPEGECRKRIVSDVTVAGAGIAGICAAVAAAREGLSVVLVNDRSVLGGNASSEIGINMNGASHLGLNAAIYAREGGLAEEIRLRMAQYSRGGGYGKAALMDAVLFDMVYGESGIHLLLNTVIYSCDREGDRIVRCYGRHCVSNVIYELESRVYIDATGNGALAYEAGCSYRMGREGRGEYQEKEAPLQADHFTMGNTFYFETEDCGREVTYCPPAFARKAADMEFIRNINKPGGHRALSVKGAHWSFEYGGQMDVVYDSEEIDLELRRLVYGIWDYIKNSGKYPEAKNYALKRVYARSGARESRRFLGDYILTENDIEEKKEFVDGVCIGGWPMDVHAPLGIYDPGPATKFIPVTGIYNIPFRCLYSRDCSNLMLAGRDISATHVALGSVRVMATCGCMGQAVGTAAKLCKELEVFPAELAQNYCEQLQDELVKNDQTIIGHRDLSACMEQFRAEASCERSFENRTVTLEKPLETDCGLALMLQTERLEQISLWIRNSSQKDTILELRVLEGDHKETFLPCRETGKRSRIIPAGFAGWAEIAVDGKRGADGKLYLVLKRNPSLSVGMTKEALTGAVTLQLFPERECRGCNHDSIPLEAASGYRYLEHRYSREENISFCSLKPEQHVFAAQMALSPYTRPYGLPNLWLGEGAYPWTLTLTADNPVQAGHLAVIFDTDLRQEPLADIPECLVRDLDVTIQYGEKEERQEIRDNCRRQAVLALKGGKIRKIVVTIIRSWGKVAGIYGVSLW